MTAVNSKLKTYFLISLTSPISLISPSPHLLISPSPYLGTAT
jgi:hypothetical protein